MEVLNRQSSNIFTTFSSKCGMEGGVPPEEWKEATIKVLHKNAYRFNCNKYRGIALVSPAGKILLKIVANRLRDWFETEGILLEEQCGFRPQVSTVQIVCS